ncbi:limulus clotting factor C-like [Pararge aegeria]|uniref:Jg24166 protein n=1 Tax=Pararge aegeria aegeria TaxID=348720 RepID=A0A8S4S7P9_9NEOP|nr:limulus clotting factor C-like [Pararge aegeria]CAH2248584.1 jg24166 [Pararge aegeria aegeria]
MKRVMLLMYVVLMTQESKSREWMPVADPFITIHPCMNTNDIAVRFEPGLPPEENNRYYVYIRKTIPANCVTKVSFDAEVNITITVRSDDKKFSKISLTNGGSFTLRFANPLAGLSFIVKGTRPGVTPYLISLRINDVEQCDTPNVDFLDKYAETENPPEDGECHWSIKNDDLRCGRRKVDRQLPVDGPSQPGDWPWHAAVLKTLEDSSQNRKLKYLCGGTLISENVVLTAAHCVTQRGSEQPYPAKNIRAALGRYNLIGSEMNSQEKKVDSIIISDRYLHANLYNDLALLKLKSAVQLTSHVQPVCLWHRTAGSAAANRPAEDEIIGTLAGWGFSDDDSLSPTLQQVNLPMVAAITCIKSNKAFALLLSRNDFCAGYKNNGTSPCPGDSGGGYVVFHPDKKQDGSGNVSGAWYLRGILSRGLKSETGESCKDDEYVIFTDMAKFGDWLDSHLDDNGGN